MMGSLRLQMKGRGLFILMGRLSWQAKPPSCITTRFLRYWYMRVSCWVGLCILSFPQVASMSFLVLVNFKLVQSVCSWCSSHQLYTGWDAIILFHMSADHWFAFLAWLAVLATFCIVTGIWSILTRNSQHWDLIRYIEIMQHEVKQIKHNTGFVRKEQFFLEQWV